MFGYRRQRWAAARTAGALAAAAVMLASCSGSGSSAVSSATAAVGSVASSVAPALSSAKDAAGSALSSASSKASAAVSSAAGAVSSAAGAVSSKVAAATGATAATVGTTSGALGVFLVGSDGRTLYMYDPDEAAPGTSTCYDACAVAWPPLLTTGTPTVTGTAAADKLSTITRTDGSTQVVYGEYPLYYYAKDTTAGQTTGQAVGGKWWVVGVDGEPIKTAG